MTDPASFAGSNQMLCCQQLSFLKFWERSRGHASLPSIESLESEALKRVADKLMLCRVMREGGDVRFLIKFHGKQFEMAHGQKCVGRYVDEAVAPSLREKALAQYRHVAESGKPAFSSTPIREGDGPIVKYERLLLPFSKFGSSIVDYICCVVTMVTEENSFNFDVAIKGRPLQITA